MDASGAGASVHLGFAVTLLFLGERANDHVVVVTGACLKKMEHFAIKKKSPLKMGVKLTRSPTLYDSDAAEAHSAISMTKITRRKAMFVRFHSLLDQ